MLTAATGMGIGFIIAFVLFAIALVSLLVYIAVWAIRRDAQGRREWDEQRQAEPSSGETP